VEGFAKVGTTGDLKPGDMKVVRTPKGKRLLIHAAGKFYAIDPECTHQGCDLADGSLSGTTLTCACHFAEFNVVTGQVEGGPAPEPVKTYAVNVVGDEVWVAA
jgi:nitrite reductase/ring-hydroxylating ferredoxin subunit